MQQRLENGSAWAKTMHTFLLELYRQVLPWAERPPHEPDSSIA
jgi:hypothetical protein